MKIEIERITVGARKRMRGDIDALAQSIADVGLLQPIVVSRDLRLIAGLHRLEACKRLGMREIEATVVDMEGAEAELAEIDENLIRNELTALERAEHLARRKVIYEELHPETRAGVAGAKARWGDATDTVSVAFSEDTASKTGLTARTVRRDVQIAEHIAPDVRDAIRDTELADSKRELVALARMPPDQQREIVRVISECDGNATLAEAKRRLRNEQIEALRKRVESGGVQQPEGAFDVVVIDPPWQYGREYDPDGSRVASPYPEMSQEQLLALNVPFADDCVLFLWTTHRFIWDAKALLDAWGFTYKATLVWDKENMGMGAWLRMQCEFCLVAVRGNPTWNNTRWRDIIREPRREHSRKPKAFYEMVEDVTVGRRLDFFSREQRDGWVSFGNETEKF